MSRVRDESGYSMVEVLVAIIILSIAIIPMFTMFDSTLKAADTGSDYDRARTFANQELEQAKNLPYDTLVDTFPLASGSFDTYTNGTARTSASQPAGTDFPDITYTATKQFVELKSNNSVQGSDEGDEGLVKVTITATWDAGKSYSTTTIISR